jgi:hypothetical protein
MCTVKTQDSNSGVIKFAHHVKSVSIARQFRTMKAGPELYTRVEAPQLPPLCTVPSWHAEAPIT